MRLRSTPDLDINDRCHSAFEFVTTPVRDVKFEVPGAQTRQSIGTHQQASWGC